ncbi:MAG TPA: response regulator [Cyclobacteriaceae bacterium]|nr:response regulator [Cyclobacteriaceae bacterium]
MNPIIFIIDDDASIRRSLSCLLDAHGYVTETFPGAEEYLAREAHNGPGCLVLDINMRGKSGMALQDELLRIGGHLPIIFITAIGSIRLSVETIRKGAINFLEKPFKEEELLHSVEEAIRVSERLLEENNVERSAQELIDTLTPRETETLKHVVTGMLNKQTAAKLNISEHTVQLHKLSISKKLGVKSVPEMITIARSAGLIS